MNGEFMISEGSKYRVNHGDEEPTTGVFKGFSALGADTAMVFELEDGTLRFISTAQIIYIDLLEKAERDEAAEKPQRVSSVYYG